MVGATVSRLTPMGNSVAMDSSNNSMSNDPSLDDHKVMVAATVTVFSGIIQVSTLSYNLPSPICFSWLVHISLIFLLLATPPHSSIWFVAPLSWPMGNNLRVTHHTQKWRGRSTLQRWVSVGLESRKSGNRKTRGEEWNAEFNIVTKCNYMQVRVKLEALELFSF